MQRRGCGATWAGLSGRTGRRLAGCLYSTPQRSQINGTYISGLYSTSECRGGHTERSMINTPPLLLRHPAEEYYSSLWQLYASTAFQVMHPAIAAFPPTFFFFCSANPSIFARSLPLRVLISLSLSSWDSLRSTSVYQSTSAPSANARQLRERTPANPFDTGGRKRPLTPANI